MLTIARGTTYSFRRKVPEPARRAIGMREVWISLRTGDRRKAESMASLFRWLTDDLFQRAGMTDDSEIEKLRQELADLQHLAKHDADRSRFEELLKRKLEITSEIAAVQTGNLRLAQEVTILQGIRDGRTIGRLSDAVAHLATSQAPVMAPEPKLLKPSPYIEDNLDSFFSAKKYTAGVQKQCEGSIKLFAEIIGKKPVREYTSEDAGMFYDMVLKLPSSHGKGGYIPALEAIKLNESGGKPTVSMKTLKRHFSPLKQYWEYLKPRGCVDEVIFAGFTFPGTKSGKSKRDDWSEGDLRRFFSSEKWQSFGKDSAYHWLPIVAMYTGMRLEEICRIRPRDVTQEAGIWSIFIQEHEAPEPWTPKTEAGERVVPIHSVLIKLGFLKLVQRRQKSPYVFSDLIPGGPDGKRGYRFSREFSKLKISLGIGPKTVFHSFRHSVRTLVEDSPLLKDSWIDAVLGHENEDASEGIKTYLKRVGINRLQEVVETINPPIDLTATIDLRKLFNIE